MDQPRLPPRRLTDNRIVAAAARGTVIRVAVPLAISASVFAIARERANKSRVGAARLQTSPLRLSYVYCETAMARGRRGDGLSAAVAILTQRRQSAPSRPPRPLRTRARVYDL